MRRPGHRADDDVVECEAKLFFLCPDFFRKSGESQTAILVYRSAGGNWIGFVALVFDIVERTLPRLADTDIKFFVDQLDIRAHHA